VAVLRSSPAAAMLDMTVAIDTSPEMMQGPAGLRNQSKMATSFV
jgi:hypothetical protein